MPKMSNHEVVHRQQILLKELQRLQGIQREQESAAKQKILDQCEAKLTLMDLMVFMEDKMGIDDMVLTLKELCEEKTKRYDVQDDQMQKYVELIRLLKQF